MHTIRMRIQSEDDLYNPFDPDGTILSDDVKAYILSHMQEKRLRESVQLMVVSAGGFDHERMRGAFNSWLDSEEQTIKRELRANLFQQIFMFAIGVVFIALSIFLQPRVTTIWFTVLSTIGAFSMWEAASIWIVKNPKLSSQRAVIKRLKNDSEIVACGDSSSCNQDAGIVQ